MKNKKLFSEISMALGLLIGIFFMSSSAQASEIYVKTQKIPNTALSAVKNVWQPMISAQISSEGKSISDFYLGTPFTMDTSLEATYIFPIIEKEDQSIDYTIEIAKQDITGESAVLSKKKASLINDLSEKMNTTKDTPVEFSLSEKTLEYKSNNSWRTLFSTVPNEKSLTTENYNSSANTKTIEVTDLVADSNVTSRGLTPEFVQNILFFQPGEFQTNLPLCYFYCLAQTINFQRGNRDMNAVKLVKEINPSITDAQIAKGENIPSVEKIIDYINKKYSAKVIFDKNQMINFSAVKNEIDNQAPAAIDFKNLDETDGKHNHALTLIGYTMTTDGNIEKYPPYYTYWNPWWVERILVSSKSSYIVLEGSRYSPYRSTYNFRIPKASLTNF